jgi:putative membrane protein
MTSQNIGPQNSDQNRGTPPANDQSRDRHTSDHLANERTFLAWIRTSISVIGLGFVVAKFSVWLRELSARLNEPVNTRQTGLSMPLGVAMMAFGGLLAMVAAWRYRTVKTAIQSGQSSAAEGTTMAVAVLVACIAAVLIVYMLAST